MRNNKGLGTIDRHTDHISLTKSRPKYLDEIEKKNKKPSIIKRILG